MFCLWGMLVSGHNWQYIWYTCSCPELRNIGINNMAKYKAYISPHECSKISVCADYRREALRVKYQLYQRQDVVVRRAWSHLYKVLSHMCDPSFTRTLPSPAANFRLREISEAPGSWSYFTLAPFPSFRCAAPVFLYLARFRILLLLRLAGGMCVCRVWQAFPPSGTCLEFIWKTSGASDTPSYGGLRRFHAFLVSRSAPCYAGCTWT